MYQVQTWRPALNRWVTNSETNYPAALSVMARADQANDAHRRIVDALSGKVVAMGKHQPPEAAVKAEAAIGMPGAYYNVESVAFLNTLRKPEAECVNDARQFAMLYNAPYAVVRCIPETVIEFRQINIRQPA